VTIPGNNTVTAADVLFEPNRIRVALSATADPDPSPDPDPDPDPPPTGDPRVRQLYVAAPALVAQQGTRTTHDVVMRRLSGGSVNSCAAASGFAWRSTTAGCSDAAGDDGFAALAALAVLAGSGVMDRRDLAVASVPLFKDGERQSVVDVVNADRWTGYVGGSYDSGRFNDDAPRSGLDYASATVLFGLDYRVTPRTVIGGAVSFGAADADYRHDGKLDSDSRTGSLYAGWAGSTGYYVSGTLSYGTSDIDQWRYVDPDDANAGRVRSSTDSTQTGASVLFGRDVTVGRQTFGAFGKILIGDVHVDGYTEEGPTTDPSVFRVGGTDSDSRIGAAGARWALFTPRATGHWVTQLRASYEHEFEGSADQVTTLSGAGAALTIPFDQPERSWWRAGASFAWVKRPSTVVGLSYDVTFAHDNQRIGTLALGVRHRF
jgi:outer membrane autotransporter protein